MEAGKDGTDIVLDQVGASGGEQVSTALHAAREGRLLDAHADGGHLSDGEDGRVQLATPCVHFVFPVGIAFRLDGWEIVAGTIGALSNLPHEAPLGVKDRLEGRLWGVFGGQVERRELLRVVAGLLDELGSGTYLVMEFGLDVADCLVGVEAVAHVSKVLLHQVNVGVVVAHVDAWVPNQDDTVAVEALGNFIALGESRLRGAAICSCAQVGIQIDDGNIVGLGGRLGNFTALARTILLGCELSASILLFGAEHYFQLA
mmetsp:Transcript_27640/g.34326  ORF Transcript_27640/g.34326 Transcript_27640/m.34326 type:complete len:259 (-) Transcript_27640:10-786(-)